MQIRNKLKGFLLNRSLMNQVMLVSSAVIVILMILTFIFLQFFIGRYEDMLNAQLGTILDISSSTVQSSIDSLEDASASFMTDDDFQEWFNTFSHSGSYSYDDYVAINEMNKYILDFVNERQAVKFAVLIDESFRTVVSAMGLNPAWNTRKNDFIKENMSDSARYKLIAPSGDINELIAVREIVDLDDPTLTARGYLVMGVDASALVKDRSINMSDYPLSSLIMFQDDVLYTELDTSEEAKQFMARITEEGQNKTVTTFNGSRYYYTYKELLSPGWKYAVYVPRTAVFGDLERFLRVAVVIFIFMVLVLLYASYKAIKRMLKPLSGLSAQMKKVQTGDFEGVSIDTVHGAREINSLAEDFNTMVERIDTLIQENYLEKMLLQESELKLLQSQINPHFLYNTLESINWMAKAGRTKEISVMVQALSKLFRNTVSNKETAITVKEELDLLENYITIQKIRFEDRLEYYNDVEEEFYKYMIPKFILQPLVENSIKYALERYSSACVIKIYAEKTEDGMRLFVEDNGPGIDAAQLERIRNKQKVESKSGIALANIRRRLEIMYHTDNTMEFESREGEGTTIIINIPN